RSRVESIAGGVGSKRIVYARVVSLRRQMGRPAVRPAVREKTGARIGQLAAVKPQLEIHDRGLLLVGWRSERLRVAGCRIEGLVFQVCDEIVHERCLSV